jgi:hypothetical protein
MRFTIDMNALIDVEKNEGAAADVRKLIALHDAGRATVQVPAIAASERLPGGKYAASIAEFKQRVRALSKKPLEILLPIVHSDVTFWEYALWANDAMVRLEKQIHDVLFPGQHYEWALVAADHGLDPNDPAAQSHSTWRQWRNRLCDTIGMWCHIHHGGDVFVTRDKNFLKSAKKMALQRLGAKDITEPSDAILLMNP